jgi:hypothetical protein
VGLPEVFCWSKFGAEAGEDATSICERKEAERKLNGGTFLWGIGNSIRPSLQALLRECVEPDVLFTPMLAAPAQEDLTPARLVLWNEAVGMDGMTYELPSHSVVTSRPPGDRRGQAHYALICWRDSELGSSEPELCVNHLEVANLLTGSTVGPSQVTSVVKRVPPNQGKTRLYRVAFHASLIYPYLVGLRSPVTVPEELRLDQRRGINIAAAAQELREFGDAFLTSESRNTVVQGRIF